MLIDPKAKNDGVKMLVGEMELLQQDETSMVTTVALDNVGNLRMSYAFPKNVLFGKLVLVGALFITMINIFLGGTQAPSNSKKKLDG